MSRDPVDRVLGDHPPRQAPGYDPIFNPPSDVIPPEPPHHHYSPHQSSDDFTPATGTGD